MRFSQKAEYAVRAAIDLALRSQQGTPARVSDVARRAAIPEKFLEAILLDLRKAGLVNSRRGPEGGHTLARPAAEITLGMIRSAIDGPLTLVEAGRRKGAVDEGLGTVWKEVALALNAVLDGVTVEEMCRRIQEHQPSDYSI
ncbi:MAG TPA: Rrf2 family transcriptional regulator [Myxococcales bacterium]